MKLGLVGAQPNRNKLTGVNLVKLFVFVTRAPAELA
jgi:hypothetical protein